MACRCRRHRRSPSDSPSRSGTARMAAEFEVDLRGAAIEFRKHLGWYVKGLPGSAELRQRLARGQHVRRGWRAVSPTTWSRRRRRWCDSRACPRAAGGRWPAARSILVRRSTRWRSNRRRPCRSPRSTTTVRCDMGTPRSSLPPARPWTRRSRSSTRWHPRGDGFSGHSVRRGASRRRRRAISHGRDQRDRSYGVPCAARRRWRTRWEGDNSHRDGWYE